MKVNINTIKPNPFTDELYGDFSLTNEDDLLLMQTIRIKGIVEPLIISNNNIIISGVRRYKVARFLCMTEVPVIVEDINEVREIDVIIHNQYRTKLPVQLAYEYEKIRKELGSKQGTNLNVSDTNKLEEVKSSVLKQISDSNRKRVVKAVKIKKELCPEKTEKEIWKELTEENKRGRAVNSILKNLETQQAKIINAALVDDYKDVSIECFKIIQGDSLEVHKQIEEDSIQCLTTSPPYWNYRTYDQNENDNNRIPLGNESDVDSYIDALVEIFERYISKMKNTSSIFVNVMDKIHNGKVANIPFKFSQKIESLGLHHIQTIIWYKRNPQYSANQRIAQPMCEYILHFTKDVKKYKWNKYWDKELDNKEFYYDVLYGKDGDVPLLKNIIIPINDTLNDSHFSLPPMFSPEVLNKHSLNKLLEDKGFKLTHSALYSYEIPMLFLLPTTQRNDVCLDVFSGLGTTGIVAFATDRSYIGVENSEIYTAQSKERFIELFKEKYKEQIV